MLKRPIIGITCDYAPKGGKLKSPRVFQYQDYADWVFRCGGLPFLLPLVGDPHAYTQFLDGLLIPGGHDIDPREFGAKLSDEEMNDCRIEVMQPERYEFEKKLIPLLREQRKPVFGICYGAQLLNVIYGGTLILDLPVNGSGKTDHEWKSDENDSRHKVLINENCKLSQILCSREIEAVSSHHQSVEKLGPGLKVSALAPDGTIEAIESIEEPFVIGVQWHPERDLNSNFTHRLFEAFINAASK